MELYIDQLLILIKEKLSVKDAEKGYLGSLGTIV